MTPNKACPASTPEAWEHHTDDDGGQIFNFCWHRLDSEPKVDWHPVYQRALTRRRDLLN